MANEKMTKRDFFNMIIVDYADTNADMVAFARHEIWLLDSRKVKTASRKADASAELKSIVYNTLVSVGKAITVTDLIGSNEQLSTYSNQKISAMLTKLRADGLVVKKTEHRQTLFFVVESEVEE